MKQAFEFYETPQTFAAYLFGYLRAHGMPVRGRVCEPCLGSGALVRAYESLRLQPPRSIESWVTNDLDPRWTADHHGDATTDETWQALTSGGPIDWTVSNTAFSIIVEVAEQALRRSGIGVALYTRASIHEVLKTGKRRTWLREHPPTGILWLPRFAYQRSRKTGEWTTDSMTSCWTIWLQDRTVPQFIRYAPEWVLEDLAAEEPGYRERMDALMEAREPGYLAEMQRRRETRYDRDTLRGAHLVSVGRAGDGALPA